MKYIIIVMMICSLFMISCKSKTEYGNCIGALGTEKPELEYEYSMRNIILAVVFSEMIMPPILVTLNQYKCPVGMK